MKILKKLFLICLITIFSGGLLFAEFQKTKLAVIDFNAQGKQLESDIGNIVSEWLTTFFVKDGRFEVVERALLKKVIEEQSFSKSGMVESNSVAELGKILGVQVMITGSIIKFDNILEINARIIDVSNASIIVAESLKASASENIEQLVAKIAKKIINDFPLRGYVVNRDGNKITIDLGRYAGVKKGMSFSIFRDGNVIKHPKTGEVLDVERIETGVIEIDEVREKMSIGTLVGSASNSNVEYGQKVKSISVQIEEGIQLDIMQPSPVQQPVSSIPYSPIPSKRYRNPYIKDLQSSDSATKQRGAKLIYKSRMYNEETLSVVRAELLNSLNSGVQDRRYIDAMAYCCKILAKSNKDESYDVLYRISTESYSQKLKGYAARYYKKRR